MKKVLLALYLTFFFGLSFGQTFDIYVCDGGNFNNPPWQILKFDENGDNPQVFINDALSWPQDIVFIEEQNVVLISNLNTGRITRYQADTGDYIDDFASNIDGPTRMKIGGDGYLYVLQWGNSGQVLRFQLDGTLVGAFTDTGVTNSIGLDWDADGNLYVSSYGGNFIRKYNQSGEDLGNFISSGLQGPTNIWFGENGDLFVNNWNGTSVKRFDSNGVFIEDFITGLSNPEGIAFYPDGNLLIGNGGTSAVKLFNSEGVFIDDIISAGSGNLLLPNAVVLREREEVAIQNVDKDKERQFLQSNIGDRFMMNRHFRSKLDRVVVYALDGRILENKDITGRLLWDASASDGGVFVIR
ncbi:MAG: hypothetical protein P1U56_13625, partial [Saprospiraceae bacterium]|nr:hypothetical protein [Saprospiraceae bacterium]